LGWGIIPPQILESGVIGALNYGVLPTLENGNLPIPREIPQNFPGFGTEVNGSGK